MTADYQIPLASDKPESCIAVWTSSSGYALQTWFTGPLFEVQSTAQLGDKHDVWGSALNSEGGWFPDPLFEVQSTAQLGDKHDVWGSALNSEGDWFMGRCQNSKAPESLGKASG